MNKSFSDFKKLNWFDIIKGIVLAVGSAVVTTLIDLFGDGSLTPQEWTLVGRIAGTTFLVYIAKNYFTSSNGSLGTNPKDEKAS